MNRRTFIKGVVATVITPFFIDEKSSTIAFDIEASGIYSKATKPPVIVLSGDYMEGTELVKWHVSEETVQLLKDSGWHNLGDNHLRGSYYEIKEPQNHSQCFKKV